MILFDKKPKHNFEDLMGSSIEVEDKWLEKKLNSHIAYGKGGGGGSQQDVPPTLQPYVRNVLNRAEGLYGTQQQYVPYMGERLVGFSPMEQLARQGIVSQATQGGLAAADPRLSQAGSYYAPALGSLEQGLATQQVGGQLLKGVAPSLGMAEVAYGQAGDLYGQTPAQLAEANRALMNYEQSLRGQAPYLGLAGQAYATQAEALGRQQPTLDEAARRYQQQQQRVGTQEALLRSSLAPVTDIQSQLGLAGLGLAEERGLAREAADVQRGAARGVDIGDLQIGRYMDPFQQEVTDIAKREAIKEAQLYDQQLSAQAAATGGFGGSRQALLEGQAASDLGGRLADIQSRGSQAAYQQALQTAAQQQQLGYGEDVARLQRETGLAQALAGLGSQAQSSALARQQLGLGGYGGLAEQLRAAATGFGGTAGQLGQIGQQYAGLAGQQGALGGTYGQLATGLQGLGGAFGQQAQGFGDLATQRGQLAGQFGQAGGLYQGLGGAYGQQAGLYGQGAGAFGQQAAGLAGFAPAFANLGQGALGQQYRELGYLSGVGEAGRGMEQGRADLAYQQFQEQRDFPAQQLQQMSSLIQGFPFQITQPPAQPSPFQQAAGAGLSIYGLSGMFRKEGGSMKPTNEDRVAYRQAGGLAGLADLGIDLEDLKEVLAGVGKFDKEAEMRKIEAQKAAALTQAGLGILSADPSRGALAAIGSGAASSLGDFATIQAQVEDLPEKERKAKLEGLLSTLAVGEKIKDLTPELIFPDITPARFADVETRVFGKDKLLDETRRLTLPLQDKALATATLAARDANITDENQIARLVMAEYARLLEPFKTGNGDPIDPVDPVDPVVDDTLQQGKKGGSRSTAQKTLNKKREEQEQKAKKQQNLG